MSPVFPRHLPGPGAVPASGALPPASVPPSVARYLAWTPLLWALGIQFLWAAWMLVALPLRRWPRGRTMNFVVGAWFAIAVAQAISSLLNGVLAGDVAGGLRSMLSFTVIGWVFAALGVAAGAAWRLSGSRFAEQVARLGAYVLLLAGLSAVLRGAGVRELQMPTLASLLLPDSEAVRFYATMRWFVGEDTLGETATRLILFFPWAPALGFGGLAIALISSRALHRRWRWLGVSGGAVAVVFSWSRLALAVGLLLVALWLMLRMPRAARRGTASALAAALVAMAAFGIEPLGLLREVRSAADGARAGSSIARELIYRHSWEGFVESPWIGNGWIGPSVHPTEPLPLGSHSTLYGTLYTGGLSTFLCWLLAMLSTGAALLHAAWRARREPPATRSDARVACGLWLVLCCFSPYESLFSFALPCNFLFVWIGGVLSEDRPRRVDAGRPIEAASWPRPPTGRAEAASAPPRDHADRAPRRHRIFRSPS